jgi:pentatricopeptide repeat protein
MWFAQNYFDSREGDYELKANVMHYNYIIDLFGRAGMLEEVETLIKWMPCEPIPT